MGDDKASSTDTTPYVGTFAIARRVLLKMVETHHVPDKKELEASLFGDEIGGIGASSTVH